MRSSIILFAALLLAGPAAAARGEEPCVNPEAGYLVSGLDGRELIVQNMVGTGNRPVRIATSCIGLNKTNFFALERVSRCIRKGDAVVATSIDGRRQRCVVTGVVPYTDPLVTQRD